MKPVIEEIALHELDITMRLRNRLEEMGIKNLEGLCKKFIRQGGNYRTVTYPLFGKKMNAETKALLQSKRLVKDLVSND